VNYLGWGDCGPEERRVPASSSSCPA
jgi:hypothetical protein